MHEVLRQRLMRRIESLPDEQVYQVLDFIEFLESKYSERHLQAQATGLQKFAEGLEDKIRQKAMNPATLREAFQLIAAADRVLASVSSAGRQIINDLGTLGETPEGSRDRLPGRDPGPPRPPSRSSGQRPGTERRAPMGERGGPSEASGESRRGPSGPDPDGTAEEEPRPGPGSSEGPTGGEDRQP
jgi:hypothetical protein